MIFFLLKPKFWKFMYNPFFFGSILKNPLLVKISDKKKSNLSLQRKKNSIKNFKFDAESTSFSVGVEGLEYVQHCCRKLF